jgi:hypothetical protein
VSTSPSSVEAELLQTAAGTFPRAIEVNAIADWTVAGNAHRKRTPVASSGGKTRDKSGRASSPSSGNKPNVAPSTNACRRVCPMPATMASRESFAPCRKNNSPMQSSVATESPWAKAPCAGATVATSTVTKMATVNRSRRSPGICRSAEDRRFRG